MSQPTFVDYVEKLRHLFAQYQDTSAGFSHRGHPYTYSQIGMILFFVMMTVRKIFRFKTQRRWLTQPPELLPVFGFATLPDRTTLSRRYKALYPALQQFLAFLRAWADDLDEAFQGDDLFEDKSLFKAQGPVWHRKDRQAGIIPPGLRNLDTEATWGRSGYHGWVYGYGLHATVTAGGLPHLVTVETGSVSESTVIDQKAEAIQAQAPTSVTGDNAYCKLARIRRWAKTGVALMPPGYRLGSTNPPAAAYKRFLRWPEKQALLTRRGTTIEPVFDLVSKVLGLETDQKQLPIKGLRNVRTCLTLGTFIVQFAMIINSIWGLPLHAISHMMAVFT